MNFDQLNDKVYLNEVSQDSEKLDNAITDSKGYILYMMEKAEIFPDLEHLMTKENVYALNFILKNYELDNTQIRSLKKYFNVGSENKVSNSKLSQEEIEEYLKEGIVLSPNTILTKETLNNFIPEINKQYDMDEYHMDRIFIQSIKKFSKEEFLSLDRAFHKNFIEAFNVFPSYFIHEDYAALYKDLRQEEEKETNQKLKIRDFKHYIFKDSDKEFLNYLLNYERNKYSSDGYSEIENIRGVKQLVSKIDFFNRYNAKDIESFTPTELEEHKSEIQTKWIDEFLAIKKKAKFSLRISELFNKRASIESFVTIVDNVFFESLVNNFPSIDFYFGGSDDDIFLKKKTHMYKLLSEYLIKYQNDKEKIEKIDIKGILENININIKEKTIEDMDKIGSIIYKEVLAKKLNSSQTLNLLGWGENYVYTEYSKDMLMQAALDNPSINLMILLMKAYKKINNNKSHSMSWKLSQSNKDLEKTINQMAKRLNKEDVKSLAKYYAFPLSKLLIYKSDVKDSEYNILDYLSKDINTISHEQMIFIFMVKKEFRKYILEKNIILPNSVLMSLLNSTEEKEIYSFVKEYTKKHKDALMKDQDVISAILKHPQGKDFVKINNDILEKENFNEWLTTISKIITLERTSNEILKNMEHNEERKEKENFVEQEIIKLKKKSRELLSTFSINFVQNKIETFIKNKDFDNVSLIKNIGHGVNIDIFYKYVENLSFDQLLKNIDNPTFCELIMEEANKYDNVSKIKLSQLNNTQSMIIAELLLPLAKEEVKVLNLFEKEGLSFAKDFVIKHMPEKIFYNHYLRLEKESIGSRESYVKERYTNEEILKIYNEVEKTKNFFWDKDTNAHYEYFFSSTYQNNAKEYFELLNIVKESNPKLYVILCHQSIFSEFIEKQDTEFNENRKTRSELEMNFVQENFDFNALTEGVKIIIKEIKEYSISTEENVEYNKELAWAAIERLCWNSYYEVMYGPEAGVYKSTWTIEQSETLLKLLMDELPLFALRIHRIGLISDVATHWKDNLALDMKRPKAVEDIILPNVELIIKDFNPSVGRSDNRDNMALENYMQGVVKYYIHENKEQELNYMSYLIQQNAFIQSEITWDYRHTHTGSKLIIDYLSENEVFQNELKIITQKFFLDKALTRKDDLPKTVKRKKI